VLQGKLYINGLEKLLKMEYNLLIREYDKHCNYFINGLIPLEMFIEIEEVYIKRYKLFLINLN
jgi:hypothetical protein